MQPGDARHRRRTSTPRTSQPKHGASDRGERMAVDGADIDRAAGAAA